MKINPLALTKSREYLGLSLEEAATILGYKKEKLALWERTEEGQRQLFEAKEHPTYKQLTHIAKKYCRNIYNFYAEEWDEQDFKISTFSISAFTLTYIFCFLCQRFFDIFC